MSGWVDVSALMETRDAPLLAQNLEQQVSSLDATYSYADHLLVGLPTTEDEVWFRLALMNEPHCVSGFGSGSDAT